MSSTFDGSKVNGLANIVDGKLDNIQVDDAFDSEACFNYLKNDETYNLKNQIEQLEINLELTSVMFEFGYTFMFLMPLSLPVFEYNAESDSWSTTRTNYTFRTIGFIENLEFDADPTVLIPISGDLTVMIGQYACDMNVTFQAVGTSGAYTMSCSNMSWRRASFA